MRLVARLAKRLAAQDFTKRWGVELGLFPEPARRRREIWVERYWTAYTDRAREICADILPEILTIVRRDEAATVPFDVVRPDDVVAAAVLVGCTAMTNRLAEALVDLFEGELIGAPVGLPTLSRPSDVAAAASIEGGHVQDCDSRLRGSPAAARLHGRDRD